MELPELLKNMNLVVPQVGGRMLVWIRLCVPFPVSTWVILRPLRSLAVSLPRDETLLEGFPKRCRAFVCAWLFDPASSLPAWIFGVVCEAGPGRAGPGVRSNVFAWLAVRPLVTRFQRRKIRRKGRGGGVRVWGSCVLWPKRYLAALPWSTPTVVAVVCGVPF